MYSFNNYLQLPRRKELKNIPINSLKNDHYAKFLKSKCNYLANFNIPKHNVAILIPTTSRNRNWSSVTESYLVNNTLPSIITRNSNKHNLCFYIGFDPDDKFYTNAETHEAIKKQFAYFTHVTFKFVCFKNISRGHVTKMWNMLFKIAFNDKNHYFLQCGDDIIFHGDWIDMAIKMLQLHRNIGITGPLCDNPFILTQSFVSRKHMEIFGCYFPESIINWGCDDWICKVYKPKYFFPLMDYFAYNTGGEPRYDIKFDKVYRELIAKIIISDKERIKKLGY
tara:strand:+ start:26629 stop:27468 length:840 start_codon:yes stop_codon:yes gene_type:complete